MIIRQLLLKKVFYFTFFFKSIEDNSIQSKSLLGSCKVAAPDCWLMSTKCQKLNKVKVIMHCNLYLQTVNKIILLFSLAFQSFKCIFSKSNVNNFLLETVKCRQAELSRGWKNIYLNVMYFTVIHNDWNVICFSL